MPKTGPVTRIRIWQAIPLAALLVCTSPAAVLAQSEAAHRPLAVDPYAAVITEASQRFNVPAAWIKGVMRAESAGDKHAISPAGAMGLMQIMPGTWADLRARHRLGRDPYNVHDNIVAGAAYIRELLDRYGSPGWIAAYNAGPARYEASLAGRPLPSETRAYVATVAPVIDGGAMGGPVMVAVADPLAWTRAPLFVVQPDRTSAADPARGERTADDGQTATPVRDVSAIVPQPGGLFATRTAMGSRP